MIASNNAEKRLFYAMIYGGTDRLIQQLATERNNEMPPMVQPAIESRRVFKTDDGQLFETREDAVTYNIGRMMRGYVCEASGYKMPEEQMKRMAQLVVDNRATLMDHFNLLTSEAP